MAGRAFFVVIGAVLSAIVLMAWGFVFWTLLPFPMNYIHTLPNEDAIGQAFVENKVAPGVYTYPGPDGMDPNDEATFEAWKTKHIEGPILHVFVGEGLEPMAPSMYMQGMLHFFVSALIAGTLLAVAGNSLKSYGSRVAFVTGLGLFAAAFVRMGDVVWFYHSFGYQLMLACYLISSWVLAGLVLAAFIRPKAVD